MPVVLWSRAYLKMRRWANHRAVFIPINKIILKADWTLPTCHMEAVRPPCSITLCAKPDNQPAFRMIPSLSGSVCMSPPLRSSRIRFAQMSRSFRSRWINSDTLAPVPRKVARRA
jgi:hypothetical protein